MRSYSIIYRGLIKLSQAPASHSAPTPWWGSTQSQPASHILSPASKTCAPVSSSPRHQTGLQWLGSPAGSTWALAQWTWPHCNLLASESFNVWKKPTHPKMGSPFFCAAAPNLPIASRSPWSGVPFMTLRRSRPASIIKSPGPNINACTPGTAAISSTFSRPLTDSIWGIMQTWLFAVATLYGSLG
jgi:hypothetical protein